MRARFEFTFVDVGSDLERAGRTELALLGSLGWEVRGIAARGDSIVVALQRPFDEDRPLPQAAAISATLDEPLVAPGENAFDSV